jgi:hypothetical protein
MIRLNIFLFYIYVVVLLEKHTHPYKMIHGVCHVLLILFLVLAYLQKTISTHHVHPSTRVLSSNMSSSFIGAGLIRMESSSDQSNLIQYVSSF